MRLRKMILMIFGLMLTLTACFEDCNKVTGPDLPPTEELVYYTIQIQYVRPEIKRADLVNIGVDVILTNTILITGGVSEITTLRKINDYRWAGEFRNKIPDNEKSRILYAMYGLDWARLEGTNDTAVVGDVFILKVKETGFEKKLENVQQNTLDVNPYKGPNAKMVLWRLKKDGTIADN